MGMPEQEPVLAALSAFRMPFGNQQTSRNSLSKSAKGEQALQILG